MTQKVDKYFGIKLAIDSFIDEYEYELLRKKLEGRRVTPKDSESTRVEVYIHKLDIAIKTKHLGLSPLDARLARLDVSIVMNPKAKQSKNIRFLNRLYDIETDPNVKVIARDHRILYSLTCDYCNENAGYSDVIVTEVMEGCDPKFKVLTVIATAHATPQLTKRIDNFAGKATTKMQFPLTRDIQLTLDF